MVPGYRYGQSAAGKRIEAFGLQQEQLRKDMDIIVRGGVLLRTLAERLEKVGDDMVRGLDHLKARITGINPVHVILGQTAQKYGVEIAEILSNRRARHLVNIRHEVMYRAVKETHLSLPDLGRILRRDHTTIGHGVRAHCQRTGDPFPRGMSPSAYRRKA